VCGVLLTACGSSGGSSATATPAATPTPAPAGPATAQITLTGDPALSGPMTIKNIECAIPGLNGMTISVSGAPQGQPPNGLMSFWTISDGSIVFTIGSGAAQTLRVRQFTGTGTTGFSAATGVHFSGSVSDTTASGTNKGTIGSITSISGSVACGDQTRGTSTVRVTGSSADGPVDVTTGEFRVECLTGSSGTFVNINGVTTVNGVRAREIISIGVSSIEFANEPVSGKAHFYLSQGNVGTTVSPTGGHVSGDAVEQATAGATPHKVHLQGDATCGSSGTY
jgi:hypothetical protein